MSVDKMQNEEVKSAVSYIANELLENAMKFSFKKSKDPIRFGLHLLTPEEENKDCTIILVTVNSLACQVVPAFQDFINEVLTMDLDELYIRQVERSASDEDGASGLGFITMKNDYAAQLGWKFETIDDEDDAIAVTTMVQIQI